MIAHRLNTIIDSDLVSACVCACATCTEATITPTHYKHPLTSPKQTQILMLDAGTVLEMGHPHLLLNEGQGLPTGGFASLVAETGPETELSLKEMARDYWQSKH